MTGAQDKAGRPLPVLQSGADLLTQMGVTIMRSGGSVSQGMKWKQWRGGKIEYRDSAQWSWSDSLVAGWGESTLPHQSPRYYNQRLHL